MFVEKIDKVLDLIEMLYFELQETRNGLCCEIQETRNGLKKDINKIQITLENEIKPDIKYLYEGYSQIYVKLENMENKVDYIAQKVDLHDIKFRVLEEGNI